jgi:proteasome lid subunit RPN8/RPN11
MSEYPNECIGYVSGGRYHQAKNVHESPTLAARMDPKLILKLVKQKKLQAIVHSHPNGPNCPSEADMKAQLDMAIPFILVSCTDTAALPPFAWGDQLEPLPLEGRGFQHGVADCYELIRDEGFFQKAGYKEIPANEARVGDGVLIQIRSSVPNHAGILVEPGLILHHATAQLAWDPSRLSRKEPLARWENYVTHYLRYEGAEAP